MFKLKSFGILVSIVIAISVKSHHTKTMISIDAKTPNDLTFLVNSVFKKSLSISATRYYNMRKLPRSMRI